MHILLALILFTPAFAVERDEMGEDPSGPRSAWYWLRRLCYCSSSSDAARWHPLSLVRTGDDDDRALHLHLSLSCSPRSNPLRPTSPAQRANTD